MKQLFLLLVSFMLLTSSVAINAQDEVPAEKVKTELTQAEKDSIMYEKLNSDQLLELKKQEFVVELERIEADSKENMPLNGLGIVTIVLLPFLFVIAIIFLNVRQKIVESKRKYDLYMKSLEMGQTIPEHFFDEPKNVSKPSNLKRGIILLMVGISFGLFAFIKRDTDLFILLATIIPTFVGIGYLLVHKLEKPAKEISVRNDEQI
jgi:hypothetical protein